MGLSWIRGTSLIGDLSCVVGYNQILYFFSKRRILTRGGMATRKRGISKITTRWRRRPRSRSMTIHPMRCSLGRYQKSSFERLVTSIIDSEEMQLWKSCIRRDQTEVEDEGVARAWFVGSTGSWLWSRSCSGTRCHSVGCLCQSQFVLHHMTTSSILVLEKFLTDQNS